MPQPINRIFLGVAAMSAASLILGGVAAVPASAAPSKDPELKSRSSVASAAKQTATDRFIVGFSGAAKSNASERSKAYGKVAKESGFSVQEVKGTSNGSQVVKAGKKLNAAETQEMINDLKSQPNVSYVEADSLIQTAYSPNDEYYDYQWNLSDFNSGLRLPSVWDTNTGAGQVVAVVDTGITSHSDLSANILPGYDMISDAAIARDGNGRDANAQDQGDWVEAGQCNSAEPIQSSWHGTHVAGSIAALGSNAHGIMGAAPGVKIVPVRTLGLCGGYMSDIADSIIWASGGAVAGAPLNQNPAKIINLSLAGWGECSVTMQNAINTAVQRGSSLFIAAGNNSVDVSQMTPANCNNTITVASSGREGWIANYSNYGAGIDITAPGGDMSMSATSGILSTINMGETTPGAEGYAFYQGTSMATPMAASVGALMLAKNPSLTPAQMEAQLKETARPLPYFCDVCGAGLINGPRAVDPSVVDAPELQHLTYEQPMIMGSFDVGSTLMTYVGEWGPAPVELSYQWFRAGLPIEGETNSSYTVTPNDLGEYIWVEVTGTKDGYQSQTVGSNGDYVVQGGLFSETPTIAGEARLGGTLQGNTGEWGPAPVNFTYQWKRNGVDIPGATQNLYAIQTDDAEKTLTFTVTGSKDGFASKTLTSAGVRIPTGVLTSVVPVIEGTGAVGSVLTANAGSWSPYPLTLSYQWNRNGVAIAGATSDQYTVTANDTGQTITVSVTGTKSGYTKKTETSAGKTITANEMTSTKPVISGETRVGSTITAVPGAWGPAPVTLSYQWFRDGGIIVGATGATRVLTGDDAGKVLTVTVTGTKAGYPTKSLTSNGTAAVAAGNLTAGTPAITGTVKVGNTLTAATGTWGPAPVTFSYQWYRSGVAIAGATAATRVLTADDLGKSISVKVTGSKAGYTAVAKTTAGTAAVAAGTLAAPVPAISGTAKVGYTLTAVPGAWTSGTSYKYQWYRSGVAIVGAASSTYALTSLDYGKSLSVRVIGSKAGYTSVTSAASKGTVAVAIGTLTAPIPTITGTAKVGYTLTAVPGAWASGTTLKYQWYRSGVAITGAVSSKYVLTGSDYAKSISVRVTGSRAGYVTVTSASRGTASIAAGTLVAGNPTISGTARSGYVLTAKPGVWTSGTTLKYQWYRSGVAIAGATGASYKLVAADRADTINVRVIGSKAGYATVTKYSGSTVRIP